MLLTAWVNAEVPGSKQPVRLEVGFEGSCPHSPAGVKQEGPGAFRVFPSWRPSLGISEESVGRSTRLGFRLVNAGQQSEPVEVCVDWQYDQAPPKDRPNFASREEYMALRDFVVVRGAQEKAWRTVMLDVEGAVGKLRLRIAPGTTEVHWHPPYTFTQCEQFVAEVGRNPRVRAEQIGQSEQGRPIRLLRITDDSPQTKKPVLIRARVHAYESAGSYALEGMVRWLLSDEPYALAAVHEYAFHVIPLANPDGVVNGLGRLTAPQGADLTFLASRPDRLHEVMKQTVDRLRPVLFVDLHNWQSKQIDGLLGLPPEVRERFLRFMPDQVQFGKQWFIREPHAVTPRPPTQEPLGTYGRRCYGTLGMAFEFSWFGRTVDDVRTAGRTALWALLRALETPPPAGKAR
jgi:hypothetical protein